MKRFSKKWMGTFIDGKLPDDNNLILQEVSKKGFEVEGFDMVKDIDGKEDALFEIKVLPNRVADAFSIRGMAREFAAVFDLPWGGNIPVPSLNDFKLNNDFLKAENTSDALYIFTAVKVTNFDNAVETPEWIRDIIVKCGGRSINLLVDVTNLMLFSFGQPAHVFDVDKMTGKIVTRFATEGEELELLDGKKIKLKGTDFVIADEARALSLAGIKGGKYAETTKETKNCLFEMANFSPTMIRKTSTHLGLRTDASKIFENGITTNKTEEVLGLLLATIAELNPHAKIEFIVNKKFEDKSPKPVLVKIKDIINSAGSDISKDEIIKLLLRQNFKVDKVSEDEIEVLASSERLDINIPEEVIEEVLRLYGFDNIASKALSLPKTSNHHLRAKLENYLKYKFLQLGFTEVFNYTFRNQGVVKVMKGLAEDKMFLRNDLMSGAKEAFVKNYNYLPILELDQVRFFEIGTVFLNDSTDEKRLIIVCDDNKKRSNLLPDLENILQDIANDLGLEKIDIIEKNTKPAAIEVSLDAMVENLRGKSDKLDAIGIVDYAVDLTAIKYKPLSIYPFIVRDVAVWVPGAYLNFENLILEIQKMALNNFEKVYKFDEFTKKMEDGTEKTSIAFRIIFQSYKKTLTDAEVETSMAKVNEYLIENGFEIR